MSALGVLLESMSRRSMEGTIALTPTWFIVESNTTIQEGESGRIVLYRDEPETAQSEADLVKWVMHYLYHLDYLETEPEGLSLHVT
jgi:hypothetical protein